MCARGRRFRRRTRTRQASADPQSFAAVDAPRDRARPSGGSRGAGETAAGDRWRRRGASSASSPRRAGRYDEAIALLEPAVGARAGQRGGAAARPARAAARTRPAGHAAAHRRAGAGRRRPRRRRALPRRARRAGARPSARRQRALQRGRLRSRPTRRSTRPGACCSSRNTTSRRRCARSRTRSRRDPEWAPGARRARRACSPTRIRRRPPPRRARRSRSTSSSPTRTCCSRSSISTTRKHDDARAKIQTVLDVNPVASRSAIAAGGDRLRARRPGRRSTPKSKRVLAINPAYGEVYRVAARSGGAQLSLRRSGRADAPGGGARSRRTPAPTATSACT